MRAQSALGLLALCSLACSWSRYDDVTDNSPIVLLGRPKQIASGFGVSLAAGRANDVSTLLVGGAPLTSGGAEFELGNGDTPAVNARDTGHCIGGAPCFFSNSPVALNGAASPGKRRDLCFVDGAGVAAMDKMGVVVRCTDDIEYALGMPEDAARQLELAIDGSQPTLFRFGADRGPDTALLASADEARRVWYYPPLERDFVELPYPADSKGRWPETAVEADGRLSQTRSLSVARVDDSGRLLAVSIADLAEVRLFYAADGVTPSYIGCLGGTPGFGRAFATGPVLRNQGSDALVISDDAVVYVFDSAVLATLPALPSFHEAGCSLGALPPEALIASFTCGSTKNISGCESSEFGAALGVGDLDGDGDGEVVVGAPSMTVRHVERAGAMILYDVEMPGDFAFMDIAFLASAEEDDQLGRSIAVADLADRQLLAAGAPGNGKVALFYCPSFLPPDLRGARCR